jgi:hypothetical protein
VLHPADPSEARQPTLRVGIIGDQTGTDDIDRAYSALEKGVKILAGKRVDFVFHVGDILESKEPENVIIAHFNRATGLLDMINRPGYLTPGDHDVNPPVFRPGSDDRSKETLFRNLYSKKNRSIKQNLYYSFDFGGYHFIALYSHETLHADPRWGNTFMARISDDQFSWLEMDLESHKHSEGMIVFLHQPLWYNWTGWLKVHHLLRRYAVQAVVAGHYHYDQSDGRIDGIQYVIVGATGGTVKQANRDGGNAWHVTVMTLDGPRVGFQLFGLDNNRPLALTPRVDMDRVQALDSMLGGLEKFFQRNPVYLDKTALVSACGSLEPAKLRLANLGNPIDVPVDLNLQFTAEKIELAGAAFSNRICQSGHTPLKCTLVPGRGISISNYSWVAATLGVQEPDPIWTAFPVLSANRVPEAGTVLDLNVRIAFKGQSGDFYVEKQASTTLKACAQ